MRIHPIILVSLFLSTCLCWEPIISTPYEFQGAQIVESTFAYANNLRYSPSTGRLYFKADKSMPNIFYMTSKGDDAKSFNVVQGSPLNASNAYPFLTFDVVNSQNTDYIIGTTYGSWFSNGFGLNIQASAADKTLSSNISTPSCYLYSFVVDNSSQSLDYRYNFYAVGYCYTPTNHATNGIILTKGQVQLLQNLPITWTITDSVESIEEGCYDVWTETLKPRMRLSREGQDQFIYVSIPGRCNSIYKYQLNSDAKFHPALVKVYKPLDSTINIVSTTFSGNQKIYFATKKFNSEESYINVLSTVDMVVKKTVKLEAQESTPILALDHHTDTLYIATAGFNKIFKYNADLVKQGIAVLPEQLKQTSSMVYHTGFLYMVTSEPNANIGRISEKNFCNDFCGVYGYCNKGTCACITDYEKSPRTGECAPYFVVRNEVEIISAQTAAAAFGVLFAFAVIAAVAGWFLWFRRQSTFNKF